MEVSQSLALTCPLHPEIDDVSPLCSWFVGSKGESSIPEASVSSQETTAERQPLSLSVQLFTTSLQGQLRRAPQPACWAVQADRSSLLICPGDGRLGALQAAPWTNAARRVSQCHSMRPFNAVSPTLVPSAAGQLPQLPELWMDARPRLQPRAAPRVQLRRVGRIFTPCPSARWM